MIRECDVCAEKAPCVETVLVCGLETAACHACRWQRSCADCREAFEQDENDRDYDAQGNPRGGE